MPTTKKEEKRVLTSREQDLLKLCKCNECPLKDAPGPVLGEGSLDAKFTIVAEAPGADEASLGYPMRGAAGRLNDTIMKSAGTTRDQVYITNTALCRPTDSQGKNAPPPPEAIRCCSERLKAEIAAVKSPVVVATGATAAQALQGHREKITDVVGTTEWSDDKLVLASFHPSYILRGKNNNSVNQGALEDVKEVYARASRFANGEMPMPPKELNIEWKYTNNTRECAEYLEEIEKLAKSPIILAIDTETEYAGDPTYTLLLVQISSEDDTWVFEYEYLRKMKNRFAKLLENDNITWVLHNLAFDFQYLQKNFGTVPKHAEDTMAMALCLTERAQRVGLKRLSRAWLNAPFYEEQFGSQKLGPNNPTSKAVTRDVLIPYSAYDARYTRWLYPIIKKLAEDMGNYQSLYKEILLPTQKSFADMEQKGMLVDIDALDAAKEAWKPRLEELRVEAQDIAKTYGFKASDCLKGKPKDESFNPGSPDQKKHLLYKLMGFKKVYKDGKETTGEEFYKAYPDAPITKVLKESAHISKMIGNYIDGVRDDIDPDGRVRPDFMIFGTETGRISVSNPPIQTIPRDDEAFSSLRSMYIVPNGHTFIEADYSILEVYVAYHYCLDQNMLDALNSADFHTSTAAHHLKILFDAVTKLQRFRAKKVTYGIMYQMGAAALAKEIGYTVPDSELYIVDWYGTYPGFEVWSKQIMDTAVKNGKLTTPTGRTRRWGMITPGNLEEVKRQAVNFPIQSLASDQCLKSLNVINQQMKEHGWGDVIATVHDSIELEVKNRHVDETVRMLAELMPTPKFPTPVETFPIEVKVGKNWSELQEVKI